MKILVMGAGAVGCYYGGRLAQAGHEVTFVARGENLRTLRSVGLTVASVHGDFHLPRVSAVELVEEASAYDLVLVCVKSYDTAQAAEALRRAVSPTTLILSLQNGVENEDILAQTLKTTNVLGGMVYIGAELMSPGAVVHTFSGRLVFGERTGEPTLRAKRLEQIFLGAGLQAELSSDITATLWDKLMWNAAFNAVATLTGRTVGELLANPPTRQLIRDTMREVIAVAQAQGLNIHASRADEHIESSQSPAMAAFATSMAQDFARGKRLEYDALNGAVVRTGQRHDVPTPLNQAFCALLGQLDRAKR